MKQNDNKAPIEKYMFSKQTGKKKMEEEKICKKDKRQLHMALDFPLGGANIFIDFYLQVLFPLSSAWATI